MGDRCALVGTGWRLSAARTAGGLDLRLDVVADADLRFLPLAPADLLRTLAPIAAMRDLRRDGGGDCDELRSNA